MEGGTSKSTIAIIATIIVSAILLFALVIANKGKLTASERAIRDLAVSVGVDEQKFISDFKSKAINDVVETDIKEAKSLLKPSEGLSTPAIYINNEKVDLGKIYTASGDTSVALQQQADDLVKYLNQLVETEKAKEEPNLPIFVKTYEDIQCPFCGNFYIVRQLAMKQLNADNIIFEHKNLPLEDLHPLSKRYAKGVEAAALQGKEDEMIRVSFEKEHGKRLDFSIIDN